MYLVYYVIWSGVYYNMGFGGYIVVSSGDCHIYIGRRVEE